MYDKTSDEGVVELKEGEYTSTNMKCSIEKELTIQSEEEDKAVIAETLLYHSLDDEG